MQLIGSPLYTYSTVIFVLLLASGIGSASSGRVAPTGTRRWLVPFAGIKAIGAVVDAWRTGPAARQLKLMRHPDTVNEARAIEVMATGPR